MLSILLPVTTGSVLSARIFPTGIHAIRSVFEGAQTVILKMPVAFFIHQASFWDESRNVEWKSHLSESAKGFISEG